MAWSGETRAKYGWTLEDEEAAWQDGFWLSYPVNIYNTTAKGTTNIRPRDETIKHMQARALEGSPLHEKAWAIYIRWRMEAERG